VTGGAVAEELVLGGAVVDGLLDGRGTVVEVLGAGDEDLLDAGGAFVGAGELLAGGRGATNAEPYSSRR
jgi:hypothetical protein